MARWRISFHDSGMGGGYHAPPGKRQRFPGLGIGGRSAKSLGAIAPHEPLVIAHRSLPLPSMGQMSITVPLR
jgi:hypothetical protein